MQSALDEMGIEDELAKGPLRRSKRDELDENTGQRLYPAIEFEEGSFYREESKDMERTIRDGKLMERAGTAAATSS